MKSFFLTLALIAGTTFGYAEGDPQSTAIKKTLASIIDYPETDKEGIVVVRISITDDGSLYISDMVSSDPIFTEFVTSKLAGARINPTEINGQTTFIYKIVFDKR